MPTAEFVIIEDYITGETKETTRFRDTYPDGGESSRRCENATGIQAIGYSGNDLVEFHTEVTINDVWTTDSHRPKMIDIGRQVELPPPFAGQFVTLWPSFTVHRHTIYSREATTRWFWKINGERIEIPGIEDAYSEHGKTNFEIDVLGNDHDVDPWVPLFGNNSNKRLWKQSSWNEKAIGRSLTLLFADPTIKLAAFLECVAPDEDRTLRVVSEPKYAYTDGGRWGGDHTFGIPPPSRYRPTAQEAWHAPDSWGLGFPATPFFLLNDVEEPPYEQNDDDEDSEEDTYPPNDYTYYLYISTPGKLTKLKCTNHVQGGATMEDGYPYVAQQAWWRYAPQVEYFAHSYTAQMRPPLAQQKVLKYGERIAFAVMNGAPRKHASLEFQTATGLTVYGGPAVPEANIGIEFPTEAEQERMDEAEENDYETEKTLVTGIAGQLVPAHPYDGGLEGTSSGNPGNPGNPSGITWEQFVGIFVTALGLTFEAAVELLALNGITEANFEDFI